MRRAFGRSRDESGVVAVVVAACAVALLVSAALVLDLGMVRLDRQQLKSAADDAVAAGLRAADDGTGEVHDSAAVCGAYQYLKANLPALAGLPDGTCASVDATMTCTPGDPATAAAYHGTTSSGNKQYEVWIKMPYSLTDASMGGPFAEESAPTLAADAGDPAQQGCDQIAVVVEQWSPPGLGKLVHAGDLDTRVRSVARVKVQDGDLAPTLLLLERHSCSVLTVGSGGSPSQIHVFKGYSGTAPATIHSDSDATGAGCGSGSNQQLFQGKQADGLVAYGGSGGSPGLITSVATNNGVSTSVVADSTANVYGTTATVDTSPGTPSPVSGRKLVTRSVVDERYLGGVTNMAINARPVWLTDHTTAPGFTQRVACSPDMTTLAGMAPTSSVYVDCPGNSGISLSGTIGAGTIYFHGFISGGNLRMPNATKIYIDDTNDSNAKINSSALNLTASGSGFCVGASASCSNLTTDPCTTGQTSAKTTLLIRRGALTSTGGLLRLCNTTVLMESGQVGSGTPSDPGACLPTTQGTPPTSTPCTGTSTTAGTSYVSLGGSTDWTAPNAYASWTGVPQATRRAAWAGGEDLALWTETYGSGATYKMAGGGDLHVNGVFMLPNASPFTISGSGAQDMSESQFIVSKFAVDGGATLTMRADSFAVPLPTLADFRRVR